MDFSHIVVVTGGLGFIGKHFVRRCLDLGYFVKNIDSISYAADLKVKSEFEEFDNYQFIESSIGSLEQLPECDALFNFAAESHVDNAITSNRKFCDTNILGVQNLLELVRMKQPYERPLFVQISTDEVYGDIRSGSHNEEDMLIPSNPYSATKAAADMLVKSWGRTYGMSWSIIRPANNYGLHQYPEKLIPKSAWRIKRGLKALMHGDGSYIRSWLHAEDTVDAILRILEEGERNSIYNVGSPIEKKNIDILSQIAEILGVPGEQAWTQIPDRSGQDVRYSLDSSKIAALGWKPQRHIDDELPSIVEALDFTRFA